MRRLLRLVLHLEREIVAAMEHHEAETTVGQRDALQELLIALQKARHWLKAPSSAAFVHGQGRSRR